MKKLVLLFFSIIFIFTANSQSINSFWINKNAPKNDVFRDYDKIDSVIIVCSGNYSSGEEFAYTSKYYYNENAIIYYTEAQNSFFKGTMIVDSNRNVISDHYINVISNKYIQEVITEFTYNAKGLLISETKKNKNNQFVSATYYKYDSLDNIIRLSSTYDDLHINSHATVKYFYHKNKYKIFFYNGYGNLVSTETKKCIFDTSENEYNSLGDIVFLKQPWFKKFLAYKYIYDDQNNWTERKKYHINKKGKKLKKPVEVVTRQIFYKNDL
ncbi:MAG: hypothetical protein JXR68_05430 [Bacteroidales bacterium]|nr:hypothetical protein [Bacteroidales bacterium]